MKRAPVIEKVFAKFLADQEERLKPRTLQRYREVLELFSRYLNGYASEDLSEDEARRLKKAGGVFCETFGPDRIIENLGMFLGYYLQTKVIAGEDFLRACGTVAKKLSRWLAENGYLTPEEAEDGIEQGGDAGRDLPRAARAALILARIQEGEQGFADKDFVEFDHFDIVALEDGEVCLASTFGGGKTYGPIAIPAEAARLLKAGWIIGCSLVRKQKRWRIGTMGVIFPS